MYLPLQVAELNSSSFGAMLDPRESGLGADLGAFCGQMGALYLFEEAVAPGALLLPAHKAFTRG